MSDLINIKKEYLLLKQVKQVRDARRNLLDFIKVTFPQYQVNWHHHVICDYAQRVVMGLERRLILLVPPRFGKSEIISRRLPAFALGLNPNEQIIACSYSADLAHRMNRDVQRIIDDDRYQQLFPNTTLSGSNIRTIGNKGTWLRNSDVFEIIGHRGYYRSAGIGGGITGMGSTLGIIDDPIKNQEDAQSKTIRDKQWEWLTTTFLTRLEKNARVILTLTHWHEDDLAGRLMQLAKDDPSADQYTVIRFPAVKEDNDNELDPREIGDPLWPDKYPIDALHNIKHNIGSRMWAALYQQRPSAEEGDIIKRQWFKYYDKLPERFDEVLQSWDLTFKDTKGSAFVSGQVWGRIGADKYLIDEIHDRLDFVASIEAIRTLSTKYPQARGKIVEDKANGPAVISVLKKEIPGLIPWNPRGSKEARMIAASPEVEAGNVWLPQPVKAPWIEDWINELCTFPNSKNSDRCDAFSQAISRFQKSKTIKVAASGTKRVSPWLG